MTDQGPLIVPMTVEAFVANEAVRTYTNANGSFSFQRLGMQYGALVDIYGDGSLNNADGNFQSTDDVNPNVPASEFYDGVYLKWRLPDAFLRADAAGVFRYVPNRWLVIRSGDLDGSASWAVWIVESDTPNPAQYDESTNYGQFGSAWLSSTGGTPQPESIGWNAELTGGAAWSEHGPAPPQLFLTAIAPGNPVFASYQPTNSNVFSLFDPLMANGVAPQDFNYIVIGWYSQPSGDPLAKGEFKDVLEALNWTVAPQNAPPDATASWSLYTGMVIGVGWQTDHAPMKHVPETVTCAVGTTAADALAALIATQEQEPQSQLDVDPDLLAALQLDLTRLFDQPDGDVLLEIAMQAASFRNSAGASQWVAEPPADSSDRKILAALNTAQARLDRTNLLLHAAQSRLYVVWWMAVNWGSNQPLFPTQQQVLGELQPGLPGTIASAVQMLLIQAAEAEEKIRELLARHPMGRKPRFRRILRTRYQMPKDPVVLLANAGAAGIVGGGSAPLVCRFFSQLLEGPDGATMPDLSGIDTASVPWTLDHIERLLGELAFLHPRNAAAAPAYDGPGTPPAANAVTLWCENPWHPLLLFWSGTFTPIIEAGEPPAENWRFEGTSYQWNGEGVEGAGEIQYLTQKSVLTPAALINLQKQVAQFIRNSGLPKGSSDLTGIEELAHLIATDDRWDLMSQALDGFHAQLLLRQPGVYLNPKAQIPGVPDVSGLIGNAAGYIPAVNSSSPFQYWRSGLFEFQTMQLIDEWGQTLDILAPATPILPSPALTCSPPAKGPNTIALTPALLQPARLAFELLPASNASPVCGWLLTNALDQSLMVYDGSGVALGELAIGGGGTICWTPPSVKIDGTLQNVIDSIIANCTDAKTFGAFYNAIDRAAAAIAPPGATFNQHLALLLGRPLAVVRASLQILLATKPVENPTWSFFDGGPPSPVLQYPFGIQLGNIAGLQDGLIGYFSGPGLDTFNIVQQSGAPGGAYLTPIGYGNYIFMMVAVETEDPPPPLELVLLVDPSVPVHASTAILPVQTIQVPPSAIDDALRRMNVTFRVDAILTDETPHALRMPLPNGLAGWSWLEQAGEMWNTSAVASQDDTAHLSATAPVARRGRLQLARPFSKKG
jgi:hypothetical protein